MRPKQDESKEEMTQSQAGREGHAEEGRSGDTVVWGTWGGADRRGQGRSSQGFPVFRFRKIPPTHTQH